MEIISKEKFIEFENICKNQHLNMYTDAQNIMEQMQISIDEYMDILYNYEDYKNRYNI